MTRSVSVRFGCLRGPEALCFRVVRSPAPFSWRNISVTPRLNFFRSCTNVHFELTRFWWRRSKMQGHSDLLSCERKMSETGISLRPAQTFTCTQGRTEIWWSEVEVSGISPNMFLAEWMWYLAVGLTTFLRICLTDYNLVLKDHCDLTKHNFRPQISLWQYFLQLDSLAGADNSEVILKSICYHFLLTRHRLFIHEGFYKLYLMASVIYILRLMFT